MQIQHNELIILNLRQLQKEKLLNDLKRSGLKLEQNQFKVAKQINIETQKNLIAQEKAQARRARITSSALIGGGFPLLFGGGPLQAIGGAIGGGVGEAYKSWRWFCWFYCYDCFN